MRERTLKLADLSEFEQKHLREQAADESNNAVRMEGDDKVVIRDEVEAEVDDLDPRAGVDADGIAMTDEVADILEKPFEQREQPKEQAEEPEEQEEEKPFEPDPADVRNFVRCMLGNKRFVKEYQAYGGNLRFTLGARSHAQDEEIVFACGNLQPARALAMLTNLRLAYSLVEIRVGEELTKFKPIEVGERVQLLPPAEGDLVDQAQEAQKTILASEQRVRELGEYPQMIYGVLSTSMRDFDMLVTALMQRANDPKHWATDSVD